VAFDTIQTVYGSSTALSWPASGIEQNTVNTCAAIDLTSSVPLDLEVQFQVTTPSGTIGDMKIGRFYVVGSLDNSNFSDGLAANTDAVTPTDPPNLQLLGVVHLRAASTTYRTPPFSVAAAFGGSLPPYVYFAFHNRCNLTIASGSIAGQYRTVKAQVGT